MINKKNEVYTDLEHEYVISKNINLVDIIRLVKTYTNDEELGEKIRKLINSKND